MRKLTYEIVKESFEKKGYKLLSKEYINAHIKLKYRCPKGHEHSITWYNWKSGQRCAYCARNVRLNIEFVREQFEKEGYILLTKKYINSNQKLEYICPKKHKHNISWVDWYTGRRCPYCAKRQPININFVRLEFAKEKYILLTKHYINSNQRLEYICSRGHKHSIRWNDWQQGCRCAICKVINMSGDKHHAWSGGSSYEPYCSIWLDKSFKKLVLERDNYQCQNPDCWGTGSKLTRHHIDYNKKNCDLSNIIVLCDSCNSRANKNRECWKELYTKLMCRKINIEKGR